MRLVLRTSWGSITSIKTFAARSPISHAKNKSDDYLQTSKSEGSGLTWKKNSQVYIHRFHDRAITIIDFGVAVGSFGVCERMNDFGPFSFLFLLLLLSFPTRLQAIFKARRAEDNDAKCRSKDREIFLLLSCNRNERKKTRWV